MKMRLSQSSRGNNGHRHSCSEVRVRVSKNENTADVLRLEIGLRYKNRKAPTLSEDLHKNHEEVPLCKNMNTNSSNGNTIYRGTEQADDFDA